MVLQIVVTRCARERRWISGSFYSAILASLCQGQYILNITLKEDLVHLRFQLFPAAKLEILQGNFFKDIDHQAVIFGQPSSHSCFKTSSHSDKYSAEVKYYFSQSSELPLSGSFPF